MIKMLKTKFTDLNAPLTGQDDALDLVAASRLSLTDRFILCGRLMGGLFEREINESMRHQFKDPGAITTFTQIACVLVAIDNLPALKLLDDAILALNGEENLPDYDPQFTSLENDPFFVAVVCLRFDTLNFMFERKPPVKLQRDIIPSILAFVEDRGRRYSSKFLKPTEIKQIKEYFEMKI